MNPAYALYNAMAHMALAVMKLVFKKKDTSKKQSFIRQQINWQEYLHSIYNGKPVHKEYNEKPLQKVWFHASSLGEYQIARPIVEYLKQRGNVEVIQTFFSPTAIEFFSNKPRDKKTPDLILPFPIDTTENVEKFLTVVNPDVAVFLVSEIWPNFMRILKEKKIPIILYSALIGQERRHSLKKNFKMAMMNNFDIIATHDSKTKEALENGGCRNVVKLPDPLFDNAVKISETPYCDPILQEFCAGNSTLIAGSIHLDRDFEMVVRLSYNFPDTRLIIVPHEVDSKTIEKVISAFHGKAVTYSRTKEQGLPSHAQCIVIDSVGSLALIYRYGKAAYVGGGFTRLLHSVTEPLVYGIPVAFGPMIHRKTLPNIMMDLGIGTMVNNAEQLCKWWEDIVDEKTPLEEIKLKAYTLTRENKGGAKAAARLITGIDDY